MDKTLEKKALSRLAGQLEKMIPSIKKRQKKEHEKADKKTVTYKGEEYASQEELREAYESDVFNSKTYDRLSEQLQEKQEVTDCGETMSDIELEILSGIINKLKKEAAQTLTPEQEKEYYKKLDALAKE